MLALTRGNELLGRQRQVSEDGNNYIFYVPVQSTPNISASGISIISGINRWQHHWLRPRFVPFHCSERIWSGRLNPEAGLSPPKALCHQQAMFNYPLLFND